MILSVSKEGCFDLFMFLYIINLILQCLQLNDLLQNELRNLQKYQLNHLKFSSNFTIALIIL